MSDTATSATADAITPANILAPASVPPPVPAPESKAVPATPKAAPVEGKEGPADEAANENTQDDPKRNSAKARIGELYAQKKAAERQAMSNAREAQELRRQLDEIRQQTNPDDWQQVQRNDVRSAVKEERLEQLQSEAHQRAEDAKAYRAAEFLTKAEAARERFPDFDQALETFARLPVSDYAADIISESEKAPEIAYYLAKNVNEAQRIAQLPPHKQGLEIARIEAKVSPAQARRTSNAPPPVPMIGASSAPSTPSLKDMGVADIGKLLGY